MQFNGSFMEAINESYETSAALLISSRRKPDNFYCPNSSLEYIVKPAIFILYLISFNQLMQQKIMLQLIKKISAALKNKTFLLLELRLQYQESRLY